MVCASSSDVTCPIASGWRAALSKTRSISTRAAAAPATPASGVATTARRLNPSSRCIAATTPRAQDITDDGAPILGSSTYTRSPVDTACASARKALALNAMTSAGTASRRQPWNPMSAALASAVIPSSRAIANDVDVVLGESEQFLHPHRMCRRCGSQPRHHAGRQHRPAPQNLLGVVGQRRRPLLQPDRPGEPGPAAAHRSSGR